MNDTENPPSGRPGCRVCLASPDGDSMICDKCAKWWKEKMISRREDAEILRVLNWARRSDNVVAS